MESVSFWGLAGHLVWVGQFLGEGKESQRVKGNVFLEFEFEQTSRGKDTDRRSGRSQYWGAEKLPASRNGNVSQDSEGTQKEEEKGGRMVRLMFWLLENLPDSM